MRRLLITIYLLYASVLIGQIKQQSQPIIKQFVPAGRIDAMIDISENEKYLLVQLDLKNDSLFNIVNMEFPSMELFSGPASYHRIITHHHYSQIHAILTDEFYKVLDSDYSLPNSSREYWVDFKQGSETQGTWSDDDAIEYTCACLGGASDCVKLGWDESWWNPLDYWGEAWYGYQPPYYQSIDEIRVTVRGAQCDDLPVWSETYMGMMDGNGNWSHDYELSIDYTDNVFIVGNAWNGSMLMPRIGSEDNYCIDNIKLEFYYTCNEPESPDNILASDGENCYTVNLTWNLPSSSITGQILYRDDTVIAQLDSEDVQYEDWGAQEGLEHIYCVQAINDCGGSTLTCNPGSIKTSPDSPSNVNASDGEYIDEVLVSWSGVSAVEDYKIYRDGSWMGIVSSDQLEYTDIIPEVDTVYEYCVEAINECGESNWQCDSGYIAEPAGDINDD